LGGRPDTPRWGLGDAAAGFFVGLVLSSAVAAAFLPDAPGETDISLTGQALSQIGLWTGLVGAAVLASRRKGTGRLAADFGLRARPVDVPVGMVAGALGQLVLVPLVAFLLRPLLGEPEVSGPVQDLVDSATGSAVIGLFVFVVLGAAVVEELFFRGLVMGALRRRMGAVAAVVITGVVFGIAHPQDLPADALALVMISLAALGMMWGALVVRTGRLGPAIVAHATFNAWTLTVLLTR
jgi:uncharacterized protein